MSHHSISFQRIWFLQICAVAKVNVESLLFVLEKMRYPLCAHLVLPVKFSHDLVERIVGQSHHVLADRSTTAGSIIQVLALTHSHYPSSEVLTLVRCAKFLQNFLHHFMSFHRWLAQQQMKFDHYSLFMFGNSLPRNQCIHFCRKEMMQ